MARFKFRLDTVLRHRKMIEHEKQREYSLAEAAAQQLQEQLTNLNKVMMETNDDLRENRLVGPIDIGFITAHRRFLVGMQRKGMDLVAKIASQRKVVEAARVALAEAAKQCKVLEKLRENQEAAWRREQRHAEAVLLDEVGTQIGFENLKEF